MQKNWQSGAGKLAETEPRPQAGGLMKLAFIGERPLPSRARLRYFRTVAMYGRVRPLLSSSMP
jgi:hypothetical protein